ncbi:MAG: hypothetical protein KF889_20615 [Alphaproteobacteria bacterium]|nr:hypothetical protein [Alphaproteobacteria bacterium]MCW5744260.1 hypothetical protein [Alphaproteobacteria bacterium]
MGNKHVPISNRNEGEGSRSAARAYNAGLKEHIDSGKVKPAAEKAKKAVESPENAELRDAEKTGLAKGRH